jgi:hypothetical protein
MPKGSLASKVVKSSRNAILKSYSKPAKGHKTSVKGDTVHSAAVAKPVVHPAELDSGYPDELSMEWYNTLNEQYENQDKGQLSLLGILKGANIVQ